MPWTLYRYLLKDLLKLLVVSTAVLVVVVSFAAAVRPLQEGLLGPGLLLKFVAYSIPTMLAFVLPLTAAFASTIVFLRLASDNEVTACSASGMSYRKILAPVLGLGVALTMGMFFLSNYVVPDFFRKAQATARDDVVTVMMSQLSKGQPFQRDDFVLYADEAQEVPVTEAVIEQIGGDVPPSRVLLLQGVALGEIGPDGVLERDVTAGTASAAVIETTASGETLVAIELQDAVLIDPQDQLAYQERFRVSPQRIPVHLSDNLKFFSLPELNELDQHPDRYEPVRRFQLELAQAIAVTRIRTAVLGASRDGGRFTLDRRNSVGRVLERYEVIGPPARGGRNTGGGLVMRADDQGPVQITRYLGDRPDRQWRAQTLWIIPEVDAQQIEPRVRLLLNDLTIVDPEGLAVANEQGAQELVGLTWPEPVLLAPGEDPETVLAIDQLTEMAREFSDDRGPVPIAARRMGVQWKVLKAKVQAQKHARAASAVACTLVLMVGTLLAIKRRGQMPLVVYFWSFLLAIGVVLVINAGENLSGDLDGALWSSLLVLWSGNLGLFGLALILYAKLARN